MATTVRGLDRVLQKLRAIGDRLPQAAGDELYRDMVGVMFQSQAIVPFDEGDLHDSGEVDRPQVSGPTASVSLHYGSSSVDYALVQHEDLSLNHPNGGQAKFLETPLQDWASSDAPRQVVERALRRAVRR